MAKIEQITYPLVIAAAIAGLWYALRGGAPASINVTNPWPSGVPASPGTQISIGNPQLLDGLGALIAATRYPLSPNPGVQNLQPVPNYLSYNMPPSLAPKGDTGYPLAAQGGMVGGHGGCGCSKKPSCNGCLSAMDGGAGCLVTNGMPVPESVTNQSLANIASAFPRGYASVIGAA